jgi:hypothetical protein
MPVPTDQRFIAQDPAGRRRWPLVVRRATEADRAQVLSFATRTWHDWDYIPNAYSVWLDAADGAFLVGTVGAPGGSDAEGNPLDVGRVVAITRVSMLSPTEAWLEGIRVDPAVRGMGVATDLQVAELQWVAAQTAAVLRYATGSNNDASHRLGARDGIVVIARFRNRWWSATGSTEDIQDEPSAFDPGARAAATERRQVALERLAERGLVVGAAAADRLWPMIDADPTFAAAQRLYEPRSWAMQELTYSAFARHVARGEVIADTDQAAAILVSEQLPSEDSELRLALLVGEGRAAAELVARMLRAIGKPFRFRVPVEATMTEHDDLFRAAGFVMPEWELHLLARPMIGGPPIPPADPSRVILVDQPDSLQPPAW